MADDEITLWVNGFGYQSWESIRVTRGIENVAGSFSLGVSDKWGDEAWTIVEGDACRINIGDETVLDGYVDKRDPSGSESSRTINFTGRDRAGDIVDCSAIVEAGTVSKGKWTFTNANVFEIASAICEPHDINVSLQAGLGDVLTKNAKVVVHPGDTCFEVISRLAGAANVLVVSDGRGGIILTRAGFTRATAIVEGQNLKAASASFDASDRFRRYLISSQVPGTDENDGATTHVLAEAIDEGVQRKNRVLLIKPDKGYDAKDAKKRADWEARIRAARSEKVTLTVQGWRQPTGKLWAPNTVTRVQASRLVGVDGDMLISQVDYAVDDRGGKITQLGVVRPDAFTPEPAATVKASGGAWKEIDQPDKQAEAPKGIIGSLRSVVKPPKKK